MLKKQDMYYFDNFKECAECSAKSAKLLYEIMRDFDENKLQSYLDEMHAIEHDADVKKHEITETLIKAFITPIDREDIVEVSRNLDDLTDKIEDVLIRIYCNNISKIRPDALELVNLVAKCADGVLDLMSEFPNFKRSKKLKEYIININSLEEQSDRKFIECMRKLHSEKDNLLEIIAWTDIYAGIEKCSDTAEHIADIVESVVMQNS